MRTYRLLPIALTLLLLAPCLALAEGGGDLVLIFDASNSMWGQIGGENKIVIARRALGELVDELPADATVGLVAYGHRREGDCADIETVVPIGPLEKDTLKARAEALVPKGKTPITASVKQAFSLLDGRPPGATVILVSDGLETCGGDPCAAVRSAKEAGGSFLLHVVGFDVGKEDTSQLECMAQAGEGHFFGAADAAALSEALGAAVAVREVPPARLSVKSVANGELHDASVHVSYASSGETAGGGRTYTEPDTNPRLIPLEAGVYNVRVKAVGLKGDIERRFAAVEVREGEPTELVVDYSSGEVAVEVRRNGELGDATVRIQPASGGSWIAGGRTYTSTSSNPRIIEITAGTYDVVVGSVEISGKPTHTFEDVVVEPGGRVELAHAFESGTLTVGAVRGGERIDATVRVVDPATNKEVAAGRTYTGEKTNPKTFTVPPGTYTVRLGEIRGERRELTVTVPAGGSATETIDFESGG